MAKTFTIDSSDLITRDIIVKGEVHISGTLDLMNKSTLNFAEERVDNCAGIITVTGNLYIQSEEVLVKNAIAYSDMKFKRDETFDQNSHINKSVVITTNRMLICGNIKAEGDIYYHSTKVHNKVKRAKIEKLKINIKNNKLNG